MSKEEVALRLTELYGKMHTITTTRETKLTDIYNIMLENIKSDELQHERDLYKRVIDEVQTDITTLIHRCRFEEDFCEEDTELEKILQKLQKAKVREK